MNLTYYEVNMTALVRLWKWIISLFKSTKSPITIEPVKFTVPYQYQPPKEKPVVKHIPKRNQHLLHRIHFGTFSPLRPIKGNTDLSRSNTIFRERLSGERPTRKRWRTMMAIRHRSEPRLPIRGNAV